MDLVHSVNDLKAEIETLGQALAGLQGLVGRQSASISPSGGNSLSGQPPDSQTRTEMLEEYRFLRIEIEAIWAQTYSTLNFLLAAIGLIVSAAFNSWGDPLVLFPMASIISIGGYQLIHIHTRRVWRIVGYMRLALEPTLGIKWESRLAARKAAVDTYRKANPRKGWQKQEFPPEFDTQIFEGHIWLLNWTNLSLLLGTVLCGLYGHSSLKDQLWGKTHGSNANLPQWEFWLWSLAAVVPTLVLAWQLLVQGRGKRGGDDEQRHLKSWLLSDPNPPCTAEAPKPDDGKWSSLRVS